MLSKQASHPKCCAPGKDVFKFTLMHHSVAEPPCLRMKHECISALLRTPAYLGQAPNTGCRSSGDMAGSPATSTPATLPVLWRHRPQQPLPSPGSAIRRRSRLSNDKSRALRYPRKNRAAENKHWRTADTVVSATRQVTTKFRSSFTAPQARASERPTSAAVTFQ